MADERDWADEEVDRVFGDYGPDDGTDCPLRKMLAFHLRLERERSQDTIEALRVEVQKWHERAHAES